MSAGTGAEEQARLARMRVQQKRRELASAEKQAHAWAAGAQGERLVAQALAALEVDGYLVLHDVHWPGRPKANLDHVVVGPGGVLVVDAKNWSGDVRVSAGVLRAGGYTKSRECHALSAAVASVAALLEPRHRTRVSGAICLVQQAADPVAADGVTVVGLASLVRWCRSRPAVLSAQEVVTVHEHLRRYLAGPFSPDQVTTAQLPARGGAVHEPSARVRARRVVRPAAGPLPRRQPASNRPAAGSHRRARSPVTGGRRWLTILVLLLLVFYVPRGVVWVAQAYGEAVASTVVPNPWAPASDATGPAVPSIP